MSTAVQAADPARALGAAGGSPSARFAIGAALLGFFVIALDALDVGVALASIGKELGSGITGLRWGQSTATTNPAEQAAR